MTQAEVAQLVSQHRLDLARVQLPDQRVKHDALGSTKTGEIGIAVTGTL